MAESDADVYRLLASTQTRGVNRVLDRSKPAAVRLIWASAVIICMSMSLYHTTYLFHLYLKFEYTTNVKERLLHIETAHQVRIPRVSRLSLRLTVQLFIGMSISVF